MDIVVGNLVVRILPPLTLWILMGLLTFLYLKYQLIPKQLRKMVMSAPLAAEILPIVIQMESLSETGLKAFVDISLLHTMLPVAWLELKVKIPSIRIADSDGKLLGIIYTSSDICFSSLKNASLKQTLIVDFCESVHSLKPILKRLSTIGLNEIKNITLKISFVLNVCINETIFISDVTCRKDINLAQLIEENHALRRSSVMEDLIFPDVEVIPFIEPCMGRIEAGLNIEFSKPPGFQFECQEIKFRLMLNGSSVADAIIRGFNFNQSMRIVFQIFPLMISSKPVTGSITTAKGILKGALKGLSNGVLYGEWGTESVVLGAKNISVLLENERQLWWILDLLDGIELEYDLPIAQKINSVIGTKSKSIADGFIKLVEIILSQPQCFVM
jgi:hypothetical protein